MSGYLVMYFTFAIIFLMGVPVDVGVNAGKFSINDDPVSMNIIHNMWGLRHAGLYAVIQPISSHKADY